MAEKVVKSEESDVVKLPVVQMVRTLGFGGNTPEVVAADVAEKYAEGYTLLSAHPYAYQKQTVGAGEVYFPVILYTFVLK